MVLRRDSRVSFMGENLLADVKTAVARQLNSRDVDLMDVHATIVRRPANAPPSWVVAVHGDDG
jgi:hypothetical protein